MEQTKLMKDCRSGKLPQSFEHEWPEEAGLVRTMMNKDPPLRPSCVQLQQLLVFYNSSFEQSPLFSPITPRNNMSTLESMGDLTFEPMNPINFFSQQSFLMQQRSSSTNLPFLSKQSSETSDCIPPTIRSAPPTILGTMQSCG
jgi:hypothetical protein